MILYADTSALVKLFVLEQHSDQVRAWVSNAAQVLVSELTRTEMLAALALKRRTGQMGRTAPDQVPAVLKTFANEWPRYQRLGTDAQLFAEAGDLALKLDLRAYDAVQLASAHRAFAVVGSALGFCSFDLRLNGAAKAIGLPVLTVA